VVTSVVLLIGDATRPEFRAAAAILDQYAGVRIYPDVPQALAWLDEDGVGPDLMVLAQARPGEFSHAAVDRLRRRAPLVPIVALLGTWCEGEMRSGQPWPGVARVYWHQWAARCPRELSHLADGRRSPWTLPATASDEERLLLEPVPDPSPPHGLVVLAVRHQAMYQWLSDALRSRGDATVRFDPRHADTVQGAAGVIFDGMDGRPEELDEIRDLAGRFRPAPLVVLLDFPRAADLDRAGAVGAATVLSKPLLLHDLWHELDRLCRS